MLGLSCLVVTSNPSIDLQSLTLHLLCFFSMLILLVVDCYLPWLVEGCHVRVWHSLNILFNFINHFFKIMLNVPSYLLKPIMFYFLISKIFLFHINVDDLEMCSGRFYDSFVDRKTLKLLLILIMNQLSPIVGFLLLMIICLFQLMMDLQQIYFLKLIF